MAIVASGRLAEGSDGRGGICQEIMLLSKKMTLKSTSSVFCNANVCFSNPI